MVSTIHPTAQPTFIYISGCCACSKLTLTLLAARPVLPKERAKNHGSPYVVLALCKYSLMACFFPNRPSVMNTSLSDCLLLLKMVSWRYVRTPVWTADVDAVLECFFKPEDRVREDQDLEELDASKLASTPLVGLIGCFFHLFPPSIIP